MVTGSSGDSTGANIFSTSAVFIEFIVLLIEFTYMKNTAVIIAAAKIIAEKTIIRTRPYRGSLLNLHFLSLICIIN